MDTPKQAQDILDFWYTEPMSSHWFSSTPDIDGNIRSRFASLWADTANGSCQDWEATPEGCLALCILLDQFPLNMFRGDAKSFSTEQQAVAVCKRAVDKKFDLELTTSQRAFLYMPLMHSEHMEDQALCIRCFETAGEALKDNLRFAHHHRGIVERFGRFPHRNAILGRESTTDELAWLGSKEAFTG